MTTPLPAWPPPMPAIRAALEQAWADGAWGKYHGPYCERLADALARFFDVPQAALCCSGSFAVELALRAVPVQAGEEVVLAAYDFPGNFRAIEAVGARPVLVDLAPGRFTMDVALLSAACGPGTRAILVSHLHGDLAPLPEIVALARQRGLAVIEDACQAPGAMLAGKRCGAWGDVGVLSFGGSKLLTAGRGGAMVTARADFAQRARLVCERGNHAFPLSELQAALLLPQLETLDAWNEQRARAVRRLSAALQGVEGLTPLAPPPTGVEPVYYKYGLWHDPSAACGSRAALIAALQAEGAPVDAGFRGFTLRSAQRCRAAGPLPNAAAAAANALVMHHPALLGDDALLDGIALAFRKAIAACRAKATTLPEPHA